MRRSKYLPLVIVAALISMSANGQIFIGRSGTVSEYTLSGDTINASLISLPTVNPLGLAADTSGRLFVSSGPGPGSSNVVGRYTFSGVPINSTLIRVPYSTSVNSLGLDGEGNIFVADLATPSFASTLGKYTTSGAGQLVAYDRTRLRPDRV